MDYNSLKKHLGGFKEFSGIIIDFNAFDYHFYQKWTDYLVYHAFLKNGGIGMNNNTIGRLVKNLKAFLKDCMRRNRIKPIDYFAYKVVLEEVDPIYRTKDEIPVIAAVACKGDKELEKVRDFFLAGCLTRLRFSAILRITPKYPIVLNNFIGFKGNPIVKPHGYISL